MATCSRLGAIPGPGTAGLCETRWFFEKWFVWYTVRSMSSEGSIEVEGTVITVLPGTMFRVVLDNKHEVLAHISGKMRKHFVRLTAGDRVRMLMSPYDLSKARITFRLR